MKSLNVPGNRKMRFMMPGFALLLLVISWKSLVPILVGSMGIETEASAVEKYKERVFRRGFEYYLRYEYTVNNATYDGVSEISRSVFAYEFEGTTWKRVVWSRDAVDPIQGVDPERLKESYRTGAPEPLKVKYLSVMPRFSVLASPEPEIELTYVYVAGIVCVLFILFMARQKAAGKKD